MKHTKIISFISAAALVSSVLSASAFAEKITMADAGYGISGGKSFTADGITAYTSTLGDLSDKYDTIDFTISVADLGGRDDLLFQVYVSANDWAVWANGGETPAISEAGTEYKFSLNVDDIAKANGRDLVICDMGFQILSKTPGDVDVTYDVKFSENGSAADNSSTSDTSKQEPAADDSSSPATGVEGIGTCFAAVVLSAGALLISRKRK